MEGHGYFTNLIIEGDHNIPLEDFTSLPEEQQMPPIIENAPTPTARPNHKRTKNFSEDEDKLLVSAWLNISTDPILGTNQYRGTLWKRVYDYFHQYKQFQSERSLSSLMHRWKDIQNAVNKFCGCLSQIMGRKQSGKTHQDKQSSNHGHD